MCTLFDEINYSQRPYGWQASIRRKPWAWVYGGGGWNGGSGVGLLAVGLHSVLLELPTPGRGGQKGVANPPELNF